MKNIYRCLSGNLSINDTRKKEKLAIVNPARVTYAEKVCRDGQPLVHCNPMRNINNGVIFVEILEEGIPLTQITPSPQTEGGNVTMLVDEEEYNRG